MLPCRKVIPKDSLLEINKSYILPNFHYCPSVANEGKLEALNKRILMACFSKSREIFGAQKPVIKLQPACFKKLIFEYVF